MKAKTYILMLPLIALISCSKQHYVYEKVDRDIGGRTYSQYIRHTVIINGKDTIILKKK